MLSTTRVKPLHTFLALGLFGSLVYLMLPAEEATKKTTKPRAVHGSANRRARHNDDLKVLSNIKPVSYRARNAFDPTVKPSAILAADLAKQAKTEKDAARFPGSLTGNEGEWSYAHFAKIDSQPVAMVENERSHQIRMLKAGETFFDLKISEVTQDRVTARTSEGKVIRVSRAKEVEESQEQQPANGMPGQGGVPMGMPVQNAMPSSFQNTFRSRPRGMSFPNTIVATE